MGGFLNSTIARKFAMALSGLFLVFFLAQHLVINSISVFSSEAFNEFSHFMGTNFYVQFLLQPVLIAGVLFHFIMGFVLEYNNRKARNIKYVSFKPSTNTSWMSRNMLLTGLVVLAFLGLHLYDFWFPEIAHKYFENHPEDPGRYYLELVAKFHSPIRTLLYVISFIFLALHLLHGFSSSFQSVGWHNKYSKGLRGFTVAFSIIVPLGFIFIALFHYFNNV
ncbi:succinate dehydrogenase cytochrome b subunit [Autumnicola psychrophila]|uniref:Succinate dehydrogenase cytochrome b subunit n=1 Tax=Autumnicola psychrophila TaxID=3075592 RepID=A0ABU3DNR8_9FLAO|nr:succinate dehydrogenase cytochrome b subunit [Zunongwangia sp. F225]MDT0685360.1 succinate dehydrogenase cytochrome b subunit [Zunongwangia sp. F225]